MQVRRVMIEIPVDLLVNINSRITKPRDTNGKLVKCLETGYKQLVTSKPPSMERAVKPA